MKKEGHTRRLFIFLGIFCLTMLMPLPGTYNSAQAASNLNTNSTTEEKQSEIKLNVKKKSLVKGNSYTLTLYNLNDSYKISFKSSDSDIASVDKDGVVTALEIGEATITVTVKEGLKTIKTLTCDITVGVPAVSIKFNTTSMTLVVGKSSLLEPIVSPNNTVEEPKFSSFDSSIATVSTSGKVTAKAVGTTYIFGAIANGTYATIEVTVVEEEVSPKAASSPNK